MKHFKLYYTSDVHGYLWPTDYIQSGLQPQGLINVAANYQKDSNTLVIDGGDMYQGSPLLQYLKKYEDIDAVSDMMNMAGYDYVTLGNHDFNAGYDELKKHLANLNATVLAENVTDENGQTLYPAEIKTLADGTKVGLIGLVTDYINIWEKPEHLAGIKIESPLIKAGQTIARLRQSADVVIGIYHGGYERDLDSGKINSMTSENIACQLTAELDLDILLTAHQHGQVPAQLINDTLTLQLPNQAKFYAQIDGELRDGKWLFTASTNSAGTISQPDMFKALQPLNDKVEAWLDQPIANLTSSVAVEEPLILAQYGNDILRWVAAVQMAATGAQITLQGLNNNPSSLPKQLTLRSILQNYPFDNTLVTKRISGADLRVGLEHTANYFVMEGQKLAVNPDWLKPKVEHYNYDLAFGIDYEIDVRRPVGHRITKLQYQGKDIQDTDYFSIAMNNYRAVGGGDYQTYANSEIIYTGDKAIQDMLVAYFEDHDQLPNTPQLLLKVLY